MPAGFTKLSDGRFRAWVRVSSQADAFDRLRTKRFCSSVTPKEIRAWRASTRATLEQLLEQHRQKRALATGAAHGFRHLATTDYLPAVKALTTYDQRVKETSLWIAEFGDRDPHSIHSHEIRAVRDRWLTEGPVCRWQKVNGVGQWVEVKGPLSASSVNHRLRALSNFYTVLFGPRTRTPKPNPVLAVPEASEPNAVPRGYHYDTIRLILDAMADRGRPVKGEKRPLESLAKVRARVMAWGGLEPTELGRIPEHDIVDAIETGLLPVPGRRKGDGAPGRVVPLNEEAVAALTDLVRLKATGPFRSRGVLRAWQIACVKTIGRTLRLKDLRHSFVTAIAAKTKDVRLAGRMVGHVDGRTTDRYALAALMPIMRAGLDATFPDKEKKP